MAKKHKNRKALMPEITNPTFDDIDLLADRIQSSKEYAVAQKEKAKRVFQEWMAPIERQARPLFEHQQFVQCPHCKNGFQFHLGFSHSYNSLKGPKANVYLPISPLSNMAIEEVLVHTVEAICSDCRLAIA